MPLDLYVCVFTGWFVRFAQFLALSSQVSERFSRYPNNGRVCFVLRFPVVSKELLELRLAEELTPDISRRPDPFEAGTTIFLENFADLFQRKFRYFVF
uniref:Uncharacterized protein MANES_01G087400 n=1 Tax=Rhizophora mucronata TaxID=61149 RepID=A0A2P2JEP1_RHIMU